MTDEEKHNGQLKEIFQWIFTQESSKFEPYDLTNFTDQELIIWGLVGRAQGRECIWKLIGIPDLEWMEVERERLSYYEMAESKMNPSPEVLADLYLAFRPDIQPLLFLMWLWLNLDSFYKEIGRRLEPHKHGKNIIGTFRGETFSRDTLFAAVKTEAKKWSHEDPFLSYRPHEETSEDLKQEALLKFWELYRKKGLQIWREETLDMLEKVEGISVPPLPRWAGLPQDRTRTLDRLNSMCFKVELEKAYNVVLPLLQGEAETLPGKTHQVLRDHWEKRDAQKRKGERVGLEETDEGLIQRSPFGVWRKGRERLDVKAGPDVSAKMLQILKEAKKHKRWGDKAVQAFKYYCEGYTEEQASQMVGIDERTFRNYISRLNKIFASKK